MKTLLQLQKKIVLLVALVGIVWMQSWGANFYRSSSTATKFNSGQLWNATTSCGAGSISWPTTSADNVFIQCSGKTTICDAATQTCGAITLSAGTLVINSGCKLTCNTIALSGSGVLTVNGTLEISGAGACFTISGGTFTAPTSATGRVNFIGGAQTIPTTSFYDLGIAGSGNKTMSSGTTIVYHTLYLTSNNLIVGSNTLQLGGSTYGSGISQTSGKIDISGGTSNLSFGGGTYNYSLSNIFSTSAPWTLNNLTMMRNLATITANGNLIINGAFTTYNGSTSMGGNLVVGGGALVTFNGPVNMNRTCWCNEITGGSTSDITIAGSSGQAASIYFDLGTTTAGGTNTIRNFTLNRTGMTFYPLSSVRIGNLLTLATGTKFSVANNTSSSSLNTLTFDGNGNSWTGAGEFVGSSYITSAYIYIYGSGVLSTPLKFNTGSASNYTLTGLYIERASSPVLQLGSNLNIISSIVFKNGLSTYGSLDINGKVIDMGSSGVIYNENTSESIFCSTCTPNTTTSYITATETFGSNTTYTGDPASPSKIGWRGLGIDITTTAVAPGATTIRRGFSERSGNDLSKGILRYFDILPTTNSGLDATLTINYFDSELNTLDETIFHQYRDPSGNMWADRNGTAVPASNYVQLSGIDAFSSWTLGEGSACAAVSVTSDPSNPTALCEPTNSFDFTVEVSGTPLFNYQWQENDGGGWTNLSNGGVYGTTAVTTGSASTTNTLTITNADASYNGYQYRCYIDNGCGNATSAAATLTVNSLSVAPTGINASANPICNGNSTDLTVNGGSLGTGAEWKWYSGSCTGTAEGNGTTLITVSPTISTTYYLKAEGTCNTTVCSSVSITVNDVSTDPTGISATANPVCTGSSTDLSVTGGSLGSGALWQWYSAGCGSDTEGSGSLISVSPTVATDYFVRAENSCNTTNCATLNVTVNSLPALKTVTGGGAYCSEETAVTVGLSGSDNGVDYRLLYNGDTLWAAYPGTGSAIDFGYQTQAGDYTVEATEGASGCKNIMTGQATVTIYNCPSSWASVAINLTGNTADSSAMLDVSDTISGILIPGFTEGERDLLNMPDTGLIIYNTTSGKINFYTNSGWREITSVYTAPSSGVTAVDYGTAINSTGVNATASAMLDVSSNSKGILIPRTLPGAIYGAAEGSIIYNVYTEKINYYNGSTWVRLNDAPVSTNKGLIPQTADGCAMNTTNANPATSAVLDVSAQNKALLIPRLTTIQRDNILPATGLIIYNKTTDKIEYFDGAGWYSLQ